MVNKQRIIAVVLVCLLVVIAGCTGWGTDDSSEESEQGPNESDDLEETDEDAAPDTEENDQPDHDREESDPYADDSDEETDSGNSGTTDTDTDSSASADEGDSTGDYSTEGDSEEGDSDEPTDEASTTVDGDDSSEDSTTGSMDDTDTDTDSDTYSGTPDGDDSTDTDSGTDDSDGDSGADNGDDTDGDSDDGDDTDADDADKDDDSDDVNDSDESDDSDTSDDSDADDSDTDGADDSEQDTDDAEQESDADADEGDESDSDADAGDESDDEDAGDESDEGDVSEPDDGDEGDEGDKKLTCDAFDTHDEAQSYYEENPEERSHLDADNDDVACEELQNDSDDPGNGDKQLTCDAFDTHEEAQSYYEENSEERSHLDDDDDGIACEALQTGGDPEMYEYELTVEVVEDGEPVEGEPVRIAVHGEEFEEYETDEDGEVRISFENSSPDDAVEHDVQVRNETRYVHVEQGEQRETFDVTETLDTATGKVIVEDENGEPVEDKAVILTPPGTVEPEEKITRHTDENGEVVIELGAGDPTDVVMYEVEVDGERKSLDIMSDEHHGVQEVRFTVPTEPAPVHSLTVYLEDTEMGDAVDGEVAISHVESGEAFSATTDDGTAAFEDIPAGTYAIEIDAGEEWYRPHDGSDEVEVDGQIEHTISMQPEPPMHEIEVIVTDAETGEPIEGASVGGIGAVHPQGFDMQFESETNSDGVAVAQTWESPYTLEVRAEGYELYMEDIVLDEDMTVEVALEPEEDIDLQDALDVVDRQTDVGHDTDNEFILFENTSSSEIDLSGHVVTDREEGGTGIEAEFPSGFTLGPGDQVRVTSGFGSPTDDEIFMNSGRAVWRQDGDEVLIIGPGGDVVFRHEYGDGGTSSIQLFFNQVRALFA